ncbi:hypothetical protein F7725_010749 [Dissostichus mawsoni]|uniref:Uncharacterized protein n=1 Tax=Dissostichus mawsoni TaxID=36200 RepID=A0A7J5ZB03_DISMA|nr:hypothetical protein F7725_010749 [Dissostichus mawsoni]
MELYPPVCRSIASSSIDLLSLTRVKGGPAPDAGAPGREDRERVLQQPALRLSSRHPAAEQPGSTGLLPADTHRPETRPTGEKHRSMEPYIRCCTHLRGGVDRCVQQRDVGLHGPVSLRWAGSRAGECLRAGGLWIRAALLQDAGRRAGAPAAGGLSPGPLSPVLQHLDPDHETIRRQMW